VKKPSLSKRILNCKGAFTRSVENKKKLSDLRKGKPAHNKGVPHPEEGKRKNLIWHLQVPDISLEDLKEFEDFLKLKYLVEASGRCRSFFNTRELFLSFLKKYYHCPQFNKIYSTWLDHNQGYWYQPSLDHITPLCQGGSWELTNLQFLTWFENRAKDRMNYLEWESFKKEIELTSDLILK